MSYSQLVAAHMKHDTSSRITGDKAEDDHYAQHQGVSLEVRASKVLDFYKSVQFRLSSMLTAMNALLLSTRTSR